MTANVTNGFLLHQQQWHNHQLVNPLHILILNLMPTKAQTECQFLNLLNELEQDVEVTFLYTTEHHFRTESAASVARVYTDWRSIQDRYFDGLIVTGAPVEQLPFEDVDYWNEFIRIKDWAARHVGQTLNECWAAQAALYHDYSIDKVNLHQKLFGIYTGRPTKHTGLGKHLGAFVNPQSRHSQSVFDRTNLPHSLSIIVDNEAAGPMVLQSLVKHEVYVTGHPEYDRTTLDCEYHRDVAKHLANVAAPEHYYDAHHRISNTWHQSSVQLYQNWLDLIESEVTNYDKQTIPF